MGSSGHRRGRRAALTLAALSAPATALATPIAVVPQPARVGLEAGPAIDLRQGAAIAAPAGDRDAAGVARYLAAISQSTLHLRLIGASGQGAPTAAIQLVRAPGLGPEAYVLDAGQGAVTITASTRAGLFYGAVTLWQLLAASPAHAIPAMHVADAPRYAWRGLLLDSARHFQSVPAIERMLDVMALHKLNTLQWHLADDQGWRLAIRRYPRLTAVGAWRASPDGGRYGGFYSQGDIRRIVAYAAERQITIVPEIEMPGHALAALRAYPARGFAGMPASSAGDWGVFPSIYNVDEATFDFLENILTEVMALFPSRTIAIGGDEAQSGEWHRSPAVQARMKVLGIKDEAALQGWFMQRIARFLANHGRRTIGWDDMLAAGGVPPGATVLSWHDAGGAAKALGSGHDVVMATDPALYFDHRQASAPGEPTGRGAVISLADVYRFDPAGAEQPGKATSGKIIGVQAQLWSEYILSDDQMLAMAWPRAAALSEVAWSPAAAREWTGFAARLPAEGDRLKALGVTPTPGAFDLTAAPVTGTGRLVSQQLKTCGNGVVLNLPGAPARPGTSKPAMLVDIMNRCWLYPASALDHGIRFSAGIAALPFNYQLAGAEKSIVLRAPKGMADELVVSRDSCDGPVLARMSLAAVPRNRVPTAVSAAIAPQPGVHDLCIFAASRAAAPLWALDWAEVAPVAP